MQLLKFYLKFFLWFFKNFVVICKELFIDKLGN